ISENKDYIYHDIAKKEGLASLLCVPLHVKGKVGGVITTYTSRPHHFSEYETHILQTVADQAAIVLDNYRLIVETNIIKEELESRKAIERAKGILMTEQGLSEDEAFKRIRKFAMNNRKSMREVADAIVISSEMKNDHI
ncbi:MAG TPA: histidine kinase, partial [Actinobacteria bacterium]|nr:histidine kinase [Actinomycetota bacterium]